MIDYDLLFNRLEEQEHKLQFTEFTGDTALKIGMSLIKKATLENKSIAIDITKHNHQIFHFSFDGTSPDNDYWIAAKRRTVERFGKSSLFIFKMLEKEGKSIEERFHVSSSEFYGGGGAFPIIIKNVGVVGTITVSGLSEEEDHDYVIKAISEYLEQRG